MILELQKMSAGEAAKLKEQEELPTGRPCKDQPSSSLDSMFDEIADEHASVSLSSVPVADAIQLETYLDETTLPRSDKAFQYWSVNNIRFPFRAQMSQKYLLAPCSRWKIKDCSALSHRE